MNSLATNYLQAALIQIVFTLVSLSIAAALWKILPQNTFARFEGQSWKLGGAFAGFVFTWGMLHYLTEETLANIASTQDRISTEIIHLRSSVGI